MAMLPRRTVLHALTLGAAWPLAGRWLAADLDALGIEIHAALATQPVAFKTFDAAAVALVTAACDRLIPADETPGAVAAGVPRFIDTIMADWETSADRDRWLRGLSSLDRDANARHGRRFADCAAAEQDALLDDLDRQVSALAGADRGSHWFARLKFLTIYGYCTSEIGLREELRDADMPGRYDGDAPYTPRRGSTPSSRT